MKVTLNDIEAVLFDLDGTLYFANSIIECGAEIVSFFRDNGKKVFFATNNSVKSREEICKKLNNMGIESSTEEIVSSGYLSAEYVLEKQLKNVYIYGSDSLIDEFLQKGIKVEQTEKAENIVLGFNTELNYQKLTEAIRVSLHAKYIIACNKERVFSGNNEALFPGCGAMVSSVEWCTNRYCDIVVGKPNTYMIDWVSKKYNISRNNILVIGDTYESDIIMANNAGCYSVLVNNRKDCISKDLSISSILESFRKYSYVDNKY